MPKGAGRCQGIRFCVECLKKKFEIDRFFAQQLSSSAAQQRWLSGKVEEAPAAGASSLRFERLSSSHNRWAAAKWWLAASP